MTRFLVLLAVCGAPALVLAGSADQKFSYIDLQPKANQKLTDNFGAGLEGNNLASLPRGEQTFEEVPFKIGENFLQLGCRVLKVPKPDRVEGIQVGRPFTKLHVLHATAYGRGSAPGQEGMEGDPLFIPDNTQIAAYKIRYEDGTIETFPVVYGHDVRDWWFSDKSKGVTRGTVAWTDENKVSKSFRMQIRLYQGTWENPHPAKKVVCIDYVKVNDTPAAPFCIAITLEEK